MHSCGSLALLSLSSMKVVRSQVCASSNKPDCQGSRLQATDSAAVPFAEAALWAASLVPVTCDRVEGPCDWAGAGDSWRYAFNNVQSALKAAHRSQLAVLPFDIDLLHELHNFIGRIGHHGALWQTNWPQAAIMARQLISAFDEWRTAVGFTKVNMELPRHIGTRFPTIGGHSLHLPTNNNWQSTVTLANGFNLPVLGFGVWRMKSGDRPGVAYQAVLWALQAGYRHIDTAQNYGNEEEVGRAMKDSGVLRGDICLVTKLSHARDYSNARFIFLQQLANLQVSYVDVYMLHHPADATIEQRREAWEQLEQLYDEGKIKVLGLSNVNIELLLEFLSFARVRPAYVQNKYSVYQPAHSLDHDSRSWAANLSLMDTLVREHIIMTGYSTIRPGHASYLRPLEDPHVVSIAAKHARTPAQVLHRWLLQLGAAVIPSSSKQSRIIENGDVFGFSLSESDMRLLNGIASLVSSVPQSFAPQWCDDVYSVGRLSEN